MESEEIELYEQKTINEPIIKEKVYRNRSEYMKEYYRNNRQKILDNLKKNYQDNKGIKIEYAKEYQKKHYIKRKKEKEPEL